MVGPLEHFFLENNFSCFENVENIIADQIQSYIKLFVLLYGDDTILLDTILLDESQFKENAKCTKTF
jgi:hypothetical protein